MKKVITFLILVSSFLNLASAGIILPPNIREHNWGGGSCVHASTVMLFRYQRKYEMASYWRRTYSGGETFPGLVQKLDANNIKWAGTIGKNNVAFLEWAIRTKRGAMVTTMGGAHMILLVHLDKNNAGFIDNNSPEKIIWKSRSDFLRDWSDSNSWGLTVVYSPPPPPMKGKR